MKYFRKKIFLKKTKKNKFWSISKYEKIKSNQNQIKIYFLSINKVTQALVMSFKTDIKIHNKQAKLHANKTHTLQKDKKNESTYMT